MKLRRSMENLGFEVYMSLQKAIGKEFQQASQTARCINQYDDNLRYCRYRCRPARSIYGGTSETHSWPGRKNFQRTDGFPAYSGAGRNVRQPICGVTRNGEVFSACDSKSIPEAPPSAGWSKVVTGSKGKFHCRWISQALSWIRILITGTPYSRRSFGLDLRAAHVFCRRNGIRSTHGRAILC